MAFFLGSLGLVLGVLVMLAGAITFSRGLPDGVELRPDQRDPLGDPLFLLSQQALGAGVVLLALDVVLRLGSRPFLVPGIILLVITVAVRALRSRRAAAD
jgi:hypothetical protein